MVKFKRNESKVIIEIEHGIFGNSQYFELELNQSFEYQAELLKMAFQENLNSHLKLLKEKYYNQGWKDAKAKTAKRKWDQFYGGWEK